MATTPKTVKTFALNGSLKDFNIPFEYLTRKFVVVTLIGTNRRELVLNTEFRFSTPTTITTLRGTAWGPGDGYDLIEIRRLTSATERLVDFADGSILRAYDINTSQVQSLHIAEEARDLTADTIGVNNDGNLDARARRIVNVADAIDQGDAVNLRMQTAWANTALNHATAAGVSAAAALVSKNAAAASEIAAYNSGQFALAQYNNSVISKDAAAASAAAALNSQNVAAAWASTNEDVLVSGGLYSAYHYMRKAQAQATLATSNGAAQVALAAAQVALATTQANNSASSASAAAGSATAAAGSATAASGSASAAASSAASVNLPNISGKAGQSLHVNSAGNALEYRHRADQYAFQVFASPNRAVGINLVDNLPGGTITLNKGSGYSNVTGRFTANIAGTYRFSLSVTRGGAPNGLNGSPQVGINKNGTSQVFALCYGSDYSSAAVELVVELLAGDYVSGYMMNVNGSNVGLYSFAFSGHLI